MIVGRTLGMEDYVAILRRRIWWIVVPTVLVPILVYMYSRTIPDEYTSKTVVLVEQQKVPGDFVRPVITQDLGERLSTMQEQILSRTRLQPIIERFGLFHANTAGASMEPLVERMRNAILVVPLVTGEGSRAAVSGFSISFTYSDARTAQQVCAEITSMFMDENLRSRERSAEGTTKFLNAQVEDAKTRLDEQDSKLAEFETRYVGQLPSQEQSNFNMLQSLTNQMDSINQAIYRIEQDKSYTENLLAQQLAAWKQAQSTNNPLTLEQQLANLRTQLVNQQSRYTETHPDVVRTKRDIANLEAKIKAARASGKIDDPVSQDEVDQEPSSIQQYRHQIYQYNLNLKERQQQQERTQQQIRQYQSRVQLSPAIEQEFKQLTRNYQTALEFYNDLLKKSKLSEIATDLERQQQGEQFRVMDPPNFPSKPSYPDRQKFVTGGIGGGLIVGVGIVLLFELKDKALRTEGDVQDLLQLRTLAMVPDLDRNQGNARKWPLQGKLWKRSKARKLAATRIGA